MAVIGAEFSEVRVESPGAAGALRVALVRLALLALSSLPVMIVVSATAESGPARSLFFTEAARPLPLSRFGKLLFDLGPPFGVALAISLVFVLFCNQLVTAAALQILDPRRRADRPVRVLSSVLRDGLFHLWPFMRIAFITAALVAAGAGVVGGVAASVARRGEIAGWTWDAQRFWLPLVQIALDLVWLLLVGAWALWTRAFVVGDSRRRVRRALWLALRAIVRHPLRTVLPFALMAVCTQLAGKAVLFLWLQAEPAGGLGVFAWQALSLALLFVQALLWVAVLRAAMRLLASGRLDDLRAQPDEPFRLLWRTLRFLGIGRRAVAET